MSLASRRPATDLELCAVTRGMRPLRSLRDFRTPPPHDASRRQRPLPAPRSKSAWAAAGRGIKTPFMTSRRASPWLRRWPVVPAVVLLASCGARTGLPYQEEPAGSADGGRSTDGFARDSVSPAADSGARPPDGSTRDTGRHPSADSGPTKGDGAPTACAHDPCLAASPLTPGVTATGTTCEISFEPGCSCSSGTQTVYYSFDVPAASEAHVWLSGNLRWGVLCACPEAACCVGPSGDTGTTGSTEAIANPGNTQRKVTLALSVLSVPCDQEYWIELLP